MNIPDSDLDFFNNPLKYLSLALFVGKRLHKFSTSANIVSLPVRNKYKSTSSSSSNLPGSSERLCSMLAILSSDIIFSCYLFLHKKMVYHRCCSFFLNSTLSILLSY